MAISDVILTPDPWYLPDVGQIIPSKDDEFNRVSILYYSATPKYSCDDNNPCSVISFPYYRNHLVVEWTCLSNSVAAFRFSLSIQRNTSNLWRPYLSIYPFQVDDFRPRFKTQKDPIPCLDILPCTTIDSDIFLFPCVYYLWRGEYEHAISNDSIIAKVMSNLLDLASTGFEYIMPDGRIVLPTTLFATKLVAFLLSLDSDCPNLPEKFDFEQDPSFSGRDSTGEKEESCPTSKGKYRSDEMSEFDEGCFDMGALVYICYNPGNDVYGIEAFHKKADGWYSTLIPDLQQGNDMAQLIEYLEYDFTISWISMSDEHDCPS